MGTSFSVYKQIITSYKANHQQVWESIFRFQTNHHTRMFNMLNADPYTEEEFQKKN